MPLGGFQRLSVLREYVPKSGTGGLLFAIAFWIVYLTSGHAVGFELTARDVLLVYFFTTIGINAHMSDRGRGGTTLLTLLAVIIVFMLAQDGHGIAVVAVVAHSPEVGLLAGSVSLLAGHGTAITAR